MRGRLEGAVESIKEYGDYFFTKEGKYLRMYGGTRAPSLLPKYAIGFIVLKEEVRQVFLDGFGSHLFDIKKVVFPPVPFYVVVTSSTKSKALRISSKNWKYSTLGRKAST